MRLVFFGTPDFAATALDALVDAGHDVAGVVCQPDKPAGRGQHLSSPPVKTAALRAGLPLCQPTSARSADFLDTLRLWAPEIIVVVAYGKILPSTILQLPRFGCINIHASILPRYRGAAPIQWAIARGESQTGITIMQMDEGMDTGAILLQRTISIRGDDTARTLHDRLAQLGAELVIEALAGIAKGEIVAVPQDETAATKAPMIRKEDGHIDWTQPAEAIERLLRAFDPWPGAFTFFAGKRLRVWRAEVVPLASDAAPGTVAEVGEAITIATGQGGLSCIEVQIEGRKRMSAGEFARGHEFAPGTRLG